MLRMKPVANAKRAEQYYAQTDGGYYHDASGLRSEWGGKAAALLGLEGTPEFEQFRRLLHGLDPHSGDQLTAKLVENRIPAWDVTASVPKGVTIALERGDSRIQEAIWQAGREALGMLEGYATTRVRKGGQQADRTTGNLIWYAVEHAETRPTAEDNMPDMDRHLHFVIPNLTYDREEAAWKAVKFRPIMDLRRFFDRSFESLLSRKMADLGYQVETKWKRDERGTRYFTWDITGIPDSLKDKNSRRTAEVDAREAALVEKMQAEQGDAAPDHLSAVARDGLGATSRRQKRDDLTLEQCRSYWDSRTTEEERQAVAATIRRAEVGFHPKPAHAMPEAVAFSMAHHFERESCVAWEELMATAMERSLGAATPAEIAREFKRQGLIVREIGGKRLATTEALQREEDALIGFAAQGRGTVAPVGVPEGLERGRLNDGQWQAVVGLLQSSNRVELVEGPAGAGKSWLLLKLDEAMRQAGQPITYLASSTDAVDVLAKDGFAAHTVARFLRDEKLQQAARGGRVVVDESSLLGHRDTVHLYELARQLDLKLIHVGDPMQHGSVPRGALMRILKQYAGIRPFTLREIMRQEDPGYRAAAALLSQGKAAEGFDALDAKGWICEIGDDAERYRRLAADYLQALAEKKSVLVISPTHKEAAAITAELRAQLRAAGRLGEEERVVTRLAAANATEAERRRAETYSRGDVLIFHQNAKGGFKKGDRFTVTDPAQVPLAEAAKFQLYRPEALALAVGDKLRCTGQVKSLDGKHKLSNGQVRGVAGWTEAGDIRLDNGWVISQEAGLFRSGFVETSFGSQGRTVQRTLVGMAAASLPATNAEQLYVSSSRSRERVTLYTDDKAMVREQVQHSSQKLAAVDLRPPKPSPWQRVKALLARRRRRAFAEHLQAAWEGSRPRPRAAERAHLPAAGLVKPHSHAERLRRESEREGGYGR